MIPSTLSTFHLLVRRLDTAEMCCQILLLRKYPKGTSKDSAEGVKNQNHACFGWRLVSQDLLLGQNSLERPEVETEDIVHGINLILVLLQVEGLILYYFLKT